MDAQSEDSHESPEKYKAAFNPSDDNTRGRRQIFFENQLPAAAIVCAEENNCNPSVQVIRDIDVESKGSPSCTVKE